MSATFEGAKHFEARAFVFPLALGGKGRAA